VVVDPPAKDNEGGESEPLGFQNEETEYGTNSPTERAGSSSETAMFEVSSMQEIAVLTSHGLALVAVVLASTWVSKLGGLSWSEGEAKLVFNWHPLLMIFAFTFMTVASLTFRCPCRSSIRYWNKLTHAISWSITVIFAAVGVTAAVKSHNDPVSGFIANLYSLHSWVGCGVMLFYILQFLAGSFFFGLQWGTSAARQKMLKLHQFFGPFIYNITAFTILLGIQEKEGFVGCSYLVQEKDTFPPAHFFDIPLECRISHSLGLIIFAMALCTSFALYNFPRNEVRHLHL